MTPRNIRVQYCALGGKVGRYFNHQYAYDCFCAPQDEAVGFQYEQRILNFISTAIDEKIERDGKPKDSWETL